MITAKRLLCFALLTTSQVFAQPVAQLFDLQKIIKCTDAETILVYIAKEFNEQPVWVGKTMVNTHITLLANKEKRTWTIVEYDSKIGCVIAAGDSTSNLEFSLR